MMAYAGDVRGLLRRGSQKHLAWDDSGVHQALVACSQEKGGEAEAPLGHEE